MDRTDPQPVTGVERPIAHVRDDGLIAKLFRFAWGVDTLPNNFCLVFWGTVLFPLGLLWRAAGAVIDVLEPLAEKMKTKKDDHVLRRLTPEELEQERQERRQRASEEENANRLKRLRKEATNARIAGYQAKIARFWQIVTKPRWLWIGIGLAIPVALVVLVIATWSTDGFLEVLEKIGFILLYFAGFIIGAALVLFVLYLLTDRHKQGSKKFFKGVGRTIAFPFVFLYKGFLTIKHATCPVIEWDEK